MENVYTIVEVAKILKTNKNKIYELIKSGELRSIKIGSIKIKESDLQNFLNKL